MPDESFNKSNFHGDVCGKNNELLPGRNEERLRGRKWEWLTYAGKTPNKSAF